MCSSSGVPECSSGIPVCRNGNILASGSCVELVPFCQLNMPQCPLNYTFVCGSGGIPSCELFDIPACKNGNDFFEGVCIPLQSPVNSPNFLSVISTPELPDIVGLPLLRDEFVGVIGFAYPGSNPSYEVKLSIPKSDLDVESVDVVDNDGIIFTSIPFKITDIINNSDTIILTLNLSDDIAIGQSTFVLNLKNGNTLTGIIEIIDPVDVEIITIRNSNRKNIAKPVIRRIYVKKNGRRITLGIRGKNFVSRQMYYSSEDSAGGLPDSALIFLVNPDIPDPNTSVTLYPSVLDTKINKTVVKHRSKFMKIKFKLPENVNEKTKCVVVIATPEGIVSARFPVMVKRQRMIISVEPSLP